VNISYYIPYSFLRQDVCHDLAKQLSYYLYSFSFSFLLDLLYIRSVGKCHVIVSQSHDRMSQYHVVGPKIDSGLKANKFRGFTPQN